MLERKVVAIIPARMESSRFPGKPLADILGLPMVEHVRRRVALSAAVGDVYVATCNSEILEAVERFGGKAIMTANTHERCTDRVEEAAARIHADIILIVQGDEPLLDPDMLRLLIDPILHDDSIQCVNLLSVIRDREDLLDVDIVKAVLNSDHDVMYYSRSPIPHIRADNNCAMYRQTGLSAFTKTFLRQYSNLPPTPLEIAESVDFLRILEHGYRIRGVVYGMETVGVDRYDDIQKVEKILREDREQKEIFEKILVG
jgi:3-deoxy-manno-octulosonate cytidylyltransferase (CMP-KDO synthetase)